MLRGILQGRRQKTPQWGEAISPQTYNIIKERILEREISSQTGLNTDSIDTLRAATPTLLGNNDFRTDHPPSDDSSIVAGQIRLLTGSTDFSNYTIPQVVTSLTNFIPDRRRRNITERDLTRYLGRMTDPIERLRMVDCWVRAYASRYGLDIYPAIESDFMHYKYVTEHLGRQIDYMSLKRRPTTFVDMLVEEINGSSPFEDPLSQLIINYGGDIPHDMMLYYKQMCDQYPAYRLEIAKALFRIACFSYITLPRQNLPLRADWLGLSKPIFREAPKGRTIMLPTHVRI